VHLNDLFSGGVLRVAADYVICATGFRPRSPLELMAPALADRICIDDNGLPRLDRDYRIKVTDDRLPPCFSIGTAEASHGLSATLISNMAVRAGELAHALMALTASDEKADHNAVL
jgi:L-ornithine N5-oxygenase